MMNGHHQIGAAVSQALAPSSEGWQRPADWLDMPVVNVGDEIVHILVAVFDNDTNHIGLRINGASYVDIGDGNGPIARTNDSRAGVTLNYADYVGSECSEGYRQARVTITPQSESSLTLLTLGYIHSLGGHDPNDAILDVKMAVPNLTSIAFKETAILYNLRRIEFVGPSAVTNWSSKFNSLRGLRELIFPTNMETATTLNQAARYAVRLSSISNLKAEGSSSFSYAFSDNKNLLVAPPLDLSSCNDVSYMFQGSGIIEFPSYDYTSATSVQGLFQDTGAAVIPSNTFPLAANFYRTYFGNVALLKIDTQHMPAATSLYQFCESNLSLRSAKFTGLSLVENTGSAFNSCDSLSGLILEGMRVGFDVSSCNMGAQALNDLFTSLGTANGAQTINIATNPGALTCDTSIATAKGWTVITA